MKLLSNALRWKRLCACTVLALASVACGASSTPRARVASDLGCTADETAVHKLGNGRWRVVGCGRTAVYLCTTPVRDCWREGDVHPVAVASPSPPPIP
ncbi:hypothetical protein [Labilithrix luteola]|nr:hypothetical protein [Labilithrix luteola]